MFFPTWFDIKKHEEVFLFTYGQLPNPVALLEHIYSMHMERLLNIWRTGNLDKGDEERLIDDGKDIHSLEIFNFLFREHECPLPEPETWNHNRFMNFYHHGETPDIAPIFVPSRIHDFNFISQHLLPDIRPRKQEVSSSTKECAIKIRRPHVEATNDLLATCRTISEHQYLTDLWLKEVKCQHLVKTDVPLVHPEAQSVLIDNSELPTAFLRDLLHQLSKCIKMQAIWIVDVNLKGLEEVLENLVESFKISHQGSVSLELNRNSLSVEFLKKLQELCEGTCVNLNLQATAR